MRARTCTRVRKKDGSNGNEGIFRHIFSLQKNARAFQFKRKDVLVQTQVRFGWNARAFSHEQKQKEILHGNGHKKRSSAELQPLLTLNLIL